MTTLFQAARVALEALDSDNPDIQLRAATALRAALAQSAPEPQHKPGCALLKIPARECDCGAEPVATFDEVWDAIDWDKWRMEPVRELVRMIHSKTSPKAALAQSEARQEPVAWMVYTQDGKSAYVTDNPTDLKDGQDAYALFPGPFERKPLTDEEIMEMYSEPRSDAEMIEFARAIERAHGIIESEIKEDKA